MKKIGFIGVGIMGKSMVRNLMKAGFDLRIFARHKQNVEDVISEGAVFCDKVLVETPATGFFLACLPGQSCPRFSARMR